MVHTLMLPLKLPLTTPAPEGREATVRTALGSWVEKDGEGVNNQGLPLATTAMTASPGDPSYLDDRLSGGSHLPG